jgi:glycosyltransferase involved in cell wall biosynthesis
MSHSSLPMFSVVIPTRARPDTLRHALRTVIAQTDRDLEIIVHESGDDATTSSVLAEFDDDRIRSFKTGKPVPMTENWERALRQATGEYIFFLGDDDGLLPNACAIARRLLETHPVEILSWRPAQYFWPDFFEVEARNKISSIHGTDLECTLRTSRTTLYATYRFRQYYIELPMLYNSFVARKLIERVYESRGRYFVGSMPDVVSGVINLCFSSQYLRCNRPLSLSGVSRHSTGHTLFTSKPKLHFDAMSGILGKIKMHPTMVYSHILVLAIGNELLILKDELFPEIEPKVDYRAMLNEAIQSLNNMPGLYDLGLAHCRSIAKKNGLQLDESDVPERAPQPPRPRLGRYEIGPGLILHTVDGQPAAVANVFDATKMLDRLLPECVFDSSSLLVEPNQIEVISLDSPGPITLDFSASGNGALLLGLGWSWIEGWGVWSMGPRSELIFPLEGQFCGSLRIAIHGRLFHPPRTLRFRIEQDSQILFEHEAHLMTEAVVLDLGPIKIPKSISPMKLRAFFAIDHCGSPAELGLNDDIRKIGLGLHRIDISAVPEKPSAGDS